MNSPAIKYNIFYMLHENRFGFGSGDQEIAISSFVLQYV